MVTLWYRPPELLLGERNYGPPVDMWGAGCIMAEMWTRSPIMQGNTEQHQLTLIAQLCGAISPEVWPAVQSLDLYNKLDPPRGVKRRVKERLKPYVKVGVYIILYSRYFPHRSFQHFQIIPNSIKSKISPLIPKFPKSPLPSLAKTGC